MTIESEILGSPVESTPNAETPISAARLAANQANARHSTGPKSDFTKNISAQNHTIHGLARHQNGTFKLLSSEDPAAFEELKQSLATEHSPLTTTEAILINCMAESNWLAARAQRLQDTCINLETGAVTNEKLFSLYMRYQTTHTRSFHKSLNDLFKLRSEKRKDELGFEAQRRKEEENKRKNEAHEMKKAAHAAEIAKKEAQTRQKAAVAALLRHEGQYKGPLFEVIFAEELAKARVTPEPASVTKDKKEGAAQAA